MKNSSSCVDEFTCVQLVICTENMSNSRVTRCSFKYFISIDVESPYPTFQKLMGKTAVLTKFYYMSKV